MGKLPICLAAAGWTLVNGAQARIGVARQAVPSRTVCQQSWVKMDSFEDATALIADQDTLFRLGLVGLLKARRPGWSCAQTSALDGVLAHLRAEPVDLVLLDLRLAGSPEAIDLHRLREQFPNQKILVIADSEDRTTILNCLAAGAHGYALKSTTTDQLLRAIEIVLSGDVFAPAALAGMPHSTSVAPKQDVIPLLTHLTDRQLEVFRLLSEGCATKTIARRLGLAVGTVKLHIAAIYRVLGANSRLEALVKARHGTAYNRQDRTPAHFGDEKTGARILPVSGSVAARARAPTSPGLLHPRSSALQ
jgi:DNA-binding NarL/FixJ family response regulator